MNMEVPSIDSNKPNIQEEVNLGVLVVMLKMTHDCQVNKSLLRSTKHHFQKAVVKRE